MLITPQKGPNTGWERTIPSTPPPTVQPTGHTATSPVSGPAVQFAFGNSLSQQDRVQAVAHRDKRKQQQRLGAQKAQSQASQVQPKPQSGL